MPTVKETPEDAKRRTKRTNKGEPAYTTIMIPYEYAMLATWHSYMTTVFLSRDPVFQFMARAGANQANEQAVEALLDYQYRAAEMSTPLFVWLHDIGRYGLGVVGRYWDHDIRTVSHIEEVQATLNNEPIIGRTSRRRVIERVTAYQGNKLYNVRPYDAYPDTRVSFLDVEKGEFFGIYMEAGSAALEEQAEQGYMIEGAVNALVKRPRGVAQDRDTGIEPVILPNDQETDTWFSGTKKSSSDVHGIYQYCIRIRADKWGLGDENHYEKWLFETDVDFSTLLSARPLGTYSQRFPWTLGQMEPDPYNLAVRGLPAIGEPIQRTIDWLINTHFFSVRRHLNDRYLFDPEAVDLASMLSPIGGRLVLRKPEARGMRPDEILYQLPIEDVTRQNMQSLQVMIDFGQRIFGINDQIMGMLNTGGRKSATEIRTSSTFGVNRLKTQAEFLSGQCWGPQAAAMLQDTQQYYDADLKLRIVGSLGQFDPERLVQVDPNTIAGFYDWIPVDVLYRLIASLRPTCGENFWLKLPESLRCLLSTTLVRFLPTSLNSPASRTSTNFASKPSPHRGSKSKPVRATSYRLMRPS
ncbi:MAG: hypothetical protein HC801_12750, partial [Nitrospira sp.]|nr:hypothetical protein [Nitrospira sp.]